MRDLTERLRDNAREWDISECPQRAEIARRAADRIEELEALVRKLDLNAYDVLMDGTVWIKTGHGLRLTGAEWHLVLTCDEGAS